MKSISRRNLLQWSLVAAAGLPIACNRVGRRASETADIDGRKIKDATFQFIAKCARNDGGYSRLARSKLHRDRPIPRKVTWQPSPTQQRYQSPKDARLPTRKNPRISSSITSSQTAYL